MAGKLNALMIQKTKKPGLFGDGDGLYLKVKPSGTKSWLFRFSINKRPRAMGLGSLDVVSLADAREKALACRKHLAAGIDPIEQKVTARQQKETDLARAMTFDQCAAAYIEAQRAGWKNAKHLEQWITTMRTYVSPVFGHLPASAIDTFLVMRALEPIWRTKTETASRVRGRIELILGWAKVHGYRDGEKPGSLEEPSR